MIVEADLNSAELRVVAILANDKPFLEALAEGRSPHVETAAELFGTAIGKESEEYTFAKSFTYRWIYTHPDKPPSGEGGQLRLYSVDVNKDRLTYMNERMNKLHPAIVQWKRGTLRELRTTRKVTTVFGRYRHFGWALSSWDGKLVAHAENASLNFKVQPVIGDIINNAFIRADTALHSFLSEPYGIVIQNHDALVVECPVNQVDAVKRVLCEAIEVPVPELGNAIIPAEFKVGPTWGEAKPC